MTFVPYDLFEKRNSKLPAKQGIEQFDIEKSDFTPNSYDSGANFNINMSSSLWHP